MTHPADAADRIDRSYLPRGEGEERELGVFFKSMNMRPDAALDRMIQKRVARPPIPAHPTRSFWSMFNRIRFSLEITTGILTTIPTSIGMPPAEGAVLNCRISGDH